MLPTITFYSAFKFWSTPSYIFLQFLTNWRLVGKLMLLRLFYRPGFLHKSGLSSCKSDRFRTSFLFPNPLIIHAVQNIENVFCYRSLKSCKSEADLTEEKIYHFIVIGTVIFNKTRNYRQQTGKNKCQLVREGKHTHPHLTLHKNCI